MVSMAVGGASDGSMRMCSGLVVIPIVNLALIYYYYYLSIVYRWTVALPFLLPFKIFGSFYSTNKFQCVAVCFVLK